MTKRFAVLGAALQSTYLIDRNDLFVGNELSGGEVEIDKISYGVSGAGINTAIALARQGHEVVLISNIGQDAGGDAIMRALDKEEIDSSYIYNISRRATGLSTVLLDKKSGEATTLTHRGASGNFDNLTAEDLNLIQPDFLVANSLNGDMEKFLEFFEKAHEMGVKVVFRPDEAEINEPKKVLGLLSDVSILILNKTAAAKLVPGSILTELLYRLNNYVPMVVITDGAMGGIAGNRETGEIYRFGIYEDVKVKDKSGVSDAFCAGFLGALAAGKSFRQSLIFASANATSKATQIGANEGLLNGDEILHPMPIQKLN